MDSTARTNIRVLIVDDSPLIRTILSAMLQDAPEVQIVGQAIDGQEAVRLSARLQPDVIIMDARMPQMDGLQATRHIMAARPTRIILLASSVSQADCKIGFEALAAGALTVIEKPHGLMNRDYDRVREQLLTAVRSMAQVKTVSAPIPPAGSSGIGPLTAMLHAFFDHPIQVIAIAASIGGPAVLRQLLAGLPSDFSIPIVLSQEIMPSFVPGLAEWLNLAGLPVRIAADGDRLTPGRVFVAPANFHLTVAPGNVIHLEVTSPADTQRTPANRLFESVGQSIGQNSIGVILSGLGRDGVEGLASLGKTKAHIIAQEPGTCMVADMPKAAIERGIVDEVLPPTQMVMRLTKLHRHVRALTGF